VAAAASGALSGSGSICDPYVVSSAIDFDNLLASFSPYSTIHLAPGTYQSQGHAEGLTTGFKPRRGQRIVGAGVDLTVIQLNVASPTANAAYFVIGADDADDLSEFEASEMTLDANQSLAAHSSIAAGGVKAFGTHVLLKRLRIINFGSQTTSQPGVAFATAGAFPGKPQPFDAVVEECEFELPGQNNVRETACISFAGAEGASDGVPAFHKGCVARDCIINCNFETKAAPISQITLSGGIATVTTKVKHGLSIGAWAVISGALVNSSLANTYNGSYTVGSVPGDYSFTYTPVTYGGISVPTVEPTGDMYVGRAPSHRVGVKTLTISGGVATLETYTPHNRIPGQNVVVNSVSGMTGIINASFTINDLGSSPSPTILRFYCSATGTPGLSHAYIGVDFYGILPNGGIGTILENNRILNTTFGVYHQTGSSKDVIIRDNYFYAVLCAIYFKLGQLSGGNASQQPTRNGSSLTQTAALAVFTTSTPHGFSVGSFIKVIGATQAAYNGTFQVASVPSSFSFSYPMTSDPGANATGSPVCNGLAAASLVYNKKLATFTTTAGHGLAFGQAVAIAGATQSPYDGVFPIASVPTPTSFTYVMPSDPGSNASGSFAFGALWQIGRVIIENNTVELVLTITSGVDLPIAIRLDRVVSSPASPTSPYVFAQAVLRNNVIRHVNDASDSTALPLAIQLNSCQAAIVEENVVHLDVDNAIQFTDCGAVKFFNNQSPSGALIQGYDTVNVHFVNELTTDADLGALLAT